MMPNITKGGDMKGLVRYLQGEGRHNEHTDPHVLGGDPFLQAMHGAEELTRESADEIAAYLDEPRRLFGTKVETTVWKKDPDTGEVLIDPDTGKRIKEGMRDAHVWHCSLAVSPKDGVLGDQQWESIAQDFMTKMGFTEESGKAPARWVAIHHGASAKGNDHIHIAASLVREDGTKWEGLYHDQRDAQRYAGELEVKYGLEVLESRQLDSAQRGARRGELEAASRADLPMPAHEILAQRVRAAAVASTSEAEWIRRVRGDGIVIKPYFAKGTTDVVSGYKTALKPESYNDKLVFFGGGRLAKSLSLPNVRKLWPEPSLEDAAAASAEWQAAFRGQKPTTQGRESRPIGEKAPGVALRRFAEFNDRLASIPHTDTGAYARAARDVSATMSAWAKFDPELAPVLRDTARVVSRSAWSPRAKSAAPRSAPADLVGSALLFEQARLGGKGKVAGAIFIQQMLRTAEALRDFQTARGNNREARVLHERVVQQLPRVPLMGYESQPAQVIEQQHDGPAVRAHAIGVQTQAPARPVGTPTPGALPSPLPRPLGPVRERSTTDRER